MATTQSPTPSKSHHTFRNFMLLVLVAVGLWAWFNYLPDQATQTMDSARTAAVQQINTWINPRTPIAQEIINPPIIITASSSGELIEMMSGNMNTGTGGSGTIIAGGNADDMMDSSSGESSVWSELDAFTSNESLDTTQSPDVLLDDVSANQGENTILPIDTVSPTSPLSDKVVNIEIGGQIITIDGTPEEDVIINAGSYRVIVQKR